MDNTLLNHLQLWPLLINTSIVIPYLVLVLKMVEDLELLDLTGTELIWEMNS